MGRPRQLLLMIGVLGALACGPWAWRTWQLWSEVKGAGTPLHFIRSSGFLVGPGLGIALLVGGLRALRLREPGPLLALGIAISSGLAALIAATLVRVSAQYVFVLLPWFAALGCFALVGGKRPARLVLGLLVLLPLALETTLYFTVRGGDRPAWRAAYRYVDAHADPNDLLFGMDAPVGEYYLEPGKRDLRNWRRVTWLDTFRAELALDWARYPRPIWYVVNDELFEDWPSDARTRMRRILAEECELVWEREVHWTPRDLSVRVYRSR